MQNVLFPVLGGFALLLAGWFAGTSAERTQEAQPPPGNLKLLEGYRHETRRGRDTRVGALVKEGGPRLHYDIGHLAGPRVRNVDQEELIWQRSQVISGREVLVARSRHGQAIVSILRPAEDERPEGASFREQMEWSDRYPANFYGAVESEEHFVDLLLMALSYAPGDGG